jgi:hypothetical protein
MTEKKYGRLEKDLAEKLADAMVAPSPNIDTFSTWLLGGTAAAIALFIANLDKLALRLGPVPSKILVSALAVSILFGLLQKYMAMLIHMGRSIFETAETNLRKLASAHAGKDITDPVAYFQQNANAVDSIVLFVSSFPPWFQRRFLNTLKGDTNQPRSEIRKFILQLIFLVLQIVAIFSSVAVAVYGL